MAGLAGAPERSAMGVVVGVTADTRRRCGGLGGGGLGVAGVTVKPFVSTGQRELRLPFVVEAPDRPAIGIVATRTGRAKPRFVPGVVMALVALRRCALEGLRAVAFLARHTRMKPDQREFRDVVIERDFLPPARFGVAGFAARAE